MVHDESAPLPQFPEPGFYYHYKHDPAGPVNNYAYEITGFARHTEDKSFLVLYVPLYENSWFAPANYQARPLAMFMENVTKDGVTKPRFSYISDPEATRELAAIRDLMYAV